MLKAVIFDADGTLLNSPEIILAAYRHVALTHGLTPPTREEIMQHMGKALHEIYQGLFPDHDPAPLVATNGEYVVAHRAEIEGYDGLRDMLDAMQADDWLMGMVTGGDHKVHELLNHHDIGRYFGSVVHSERVTKQKPDPESLLLACKELGVTPEETIMVGDMRHDVEIGKNAGAALTIGVTHGFGTRDDLDKAGADRIVDSLIELQQYLSKLKAGQGE